MSNSRNNDIEKMIESGELAVMTECAYGKAVGDSELSNTLKKKKKKEDGEENEK